MSKFVTIPHEQWLHMLATMNRIDQTLKAMGFNRQPKKVDYVEPAIAKDLLGLKSDKTLHKLRDEGKIIASKVGKKYLYSIQSIETFLQSNSSQL
jgi:hypothetical protein